MITSRDGANWATATTLSQKNRVAYANGLGWVLVGDGGRAASSVDGVTWRPVTRSYLGSIVAGPTGYVAVGESGTIVVSP